MAVPLEAGSDEGRGLRRASSWGDCGSSVMHEAVIATYDWSVVAKETADR